MTRIRRKHELDKEYPIANYIPDGVVRLLVGLEHEESGDTKITAKYRVRRNVGVKDDTPLVLDLAPEVKLLSVKINGWVRTPGRTAESIIIRGVPGTFEIETVNLINTKDNTTGEGLYQAGEDLLLTQNEPEDLRKIFPYFDCPKVMAPFRTTIIGNKEKFPVMLSNGNLIDVGEKEGRVHWKTYNLPFAIPSYLFALVAGKLSVLKDSYTTTSGRVVNLEIYAGEKDIGKCHHAMASLKHAMAYDEEWYGHIYKGNEYKIVATPYFNMGAMENKGLNIFNVSCVLASPETATDENYERVEGVVGHEEFHDFTGDDITCVDWRELGVKESITVRRDHLFSECYRGWGLRKVISSVLLMQSEQFAEDAGPNRHAVRPAEIKEPNNMYTRTVYEKGAEVYKTLEGIIGREGFIKGMKLYAERHDGQATRIEDLMRCMEDANDVDLYQYRNWFTQSGTPRVTVNSLYLPFLKWFVLLVRQSCTMAPDRTVMEPFDIPFTVGLIGKNGVMQEKTLRITKPMETFVFTNIPEKPALSLNRNFAPVNVRNRYGKGELARLMTRDTNLFARWDAGFKYGAQSLLELIENVKTDREPILDQGYVEALGEVIREDGIDKNLLAAMMSLPGEQALANMCEKGTVDPHAIHKAREIATRVIAGKYRQYFQGLYYENRTQPNDPLIPNPELVARRSVANTALLYMAENNATHEIGRTVFSQFEKAIGMSDKFTALSILVNNRHKPNFGRFAEKALDAFYEQFKDDNNTVDKWFAVQASCSFSDTIPRVKELMNHPAFDLKNPNRVRSLLFIFALDSLQFHTAEGYRLYADFLAEYAPMNDIVASRMVEPLTDWKRYTPRLQELMKNELLRLREKLWKVPNEKVRGTMEKIEKGLAQ